MAVRQTQQSKPADWPAERTLSILRKQLAGLEKLKGRRYSEARADEQLWQEITLSTLIHGFGDGSQNVRNYYAARSAGVHNLYGVDEDQRQSNFDQRVERFAITLQSSIAELEVDLPAPAANGIYEPGDDFAFYRDLKGILSNAAKDVFIVDNYLNTEFFELYVAPIPAGVPVRILTDQLRGNLQAVATKYSRRGNFELRTGGDVHDRHVFIDGRGWIIGQSIKDAAVKKPTYMIELAAPLARSAQGIYEELWSRATPQ